MAGPTVLLIDDEEMFVEYLARRLRARGLDVVTAHDGPSGLEAARTLRPQVVVLDLLMPGMNGLETFEALRIVSPGSRVIILTGHGIEPPDDLVAGDAPVSFFLKPVSLDQVFRAIADALGRQRSNMAVTAQGQGSDNG